MIILFVCETQGHNPHLRTSQPTGGILNSLTLIPEYLASKGHEVYVDSTYGKNEIVNGVHYVTKGESIPKWDIVIFNRNILPKDFILYSKEIGAKVVWWLHDVVQLSYLHDDAFKYVDKIIALSNYCKETYSDFYKLELDKFLVIPNGVDKELFYPGPQEKRNPNLVLTASALIKGYLPIPTVYENLKRHNHNIDFRIYSSQKLHGLENSLPQQEFLGTMEQAGAHIYSPVSPESLGHLLRQANCLLMPNSYPEICSNLLLQAQASGCPVITSDIGSAKEFIEHKKTGLLTTKYKPHDLHSWVVEYTDLVLDNYLDLELNQFISKESPKNVKSWDQIGEVWNVELSALAKRELGVL